MSEYEVIKEWKKAALIDLSYICRELDEILEKPSLIIIEGEVGAGKTTFVKSFIPESDTSSPTYSLINETSVFLHADFYRLKNESDIAELELELYLEGKNYFLVEWGKKYLYTIKKYLPETFNLYELKIEQIKNSDSEFRNFVLSSID